MPETRRSGPPERGRGGGLLRLRGVLLVVACLVPLHLLAPPTHGQESTYRIGPKDVLKITVYGHDDLTRTVIVSDQGILPFPLIGEMPAAGLTPTQLEVRLKDLLGKDYLVDPQVSVSVQEYRSQKVFVLGEVERPGTYVLTGQASVLDILSQAGGPGKSAGRHVIVVRVPRSDGPAVPGTAGSTTVQINLQRLLAGDVSENLPLQHGDTVYIPKVTSFFVLGEVQRQGSYVMDKDTTVLEAVTLAGGFTDRAAPAGAKLLRKRADGSQDTIDVDLSGTDLRAREVLVAEGDTVFVPRGNTFFVSGEVRKPGAYQLDRPTTAFGAITLAGGFTDRAAQAQAKLSRRLATGEEQTVVLDLSGTDPQARDTPIKDGDTLLVPPGNLFFVLGEVRKPGAYQLDKSVTAFGAIALAGGFTDKAGQSQVKVIRRGAKGEEEQEILDLTGGDARGREFPLRDGDTVLVPPGNTFFVSGEVRRPGAYQLDRPTTAFGAITLAGGFTEKAGQTQVKLLRRGATGEEEQLVLDLSGTDPRARDHALRDSDTLVVPSGNTVFVLGEVRRPGAYQLDKSITTFGAVALAGGFTEKAGQSQVKVIRRGTAGEEEQLVLDLSGSDPRARDYTLKDGDTLVVPTGNTFFVLGEVRRPGVYQLDKTVTAFSAIAMAGGFTEKAAESQAKVIRRLPSGDEETVVLDLSGADPRARDFALKDGDALVVPSGNTFFVLGEVRRPGAFQLDRNTTAIGGITLAGGFTEKGAQTQVKLIRRIASGEEHLVLDLSGSDPRARDHPLKDGDTLVVPSGNTVFVLGEVKRPGAYQLDRNTTAIGGITLAGGFSEKASQGHVKLTRRLPSGEEQQVILDLSGADARARDYPLKDGDTLVVPTGNTFYVLGEVRKPGAYQIDQVTTAIQAIAMAGGFTDKAAPNRTRIIRTHRDGRQETLTVDLNEVIKRGRREKDVSILANDVIVVPESFF